MCIRDSGGGDQTAVKALGTKGQEDLQNMVAILDRALLDAPCLLYTSDAADDLLCVDLGGRRIIKKKKKNKRRQSLTHNYKKKHVIIQSTSTCNTTQES